MQKTKQALAALVVALAAASCSGGGDEAAPAVTVAVAEATSSTSSTSSTTTSTSSSTTTTSTTTTEALSSDEEQIELLIEEFWSGLYASQDPPDPELVDWEAIATAENAAERRDRLEARRESGIGISQVQPGPYVLSTEISLVNADLAIAFVCLRDDAFAYEVGSGEVTDEASVIASKRMEVQRTSGGWRVHSSEQLRNFFPDEEAECAASH